LHAFPIDYVPNRNRPAIDKVRDGGGYSYLLSHIADFKLKILNNSPRHFDSNSLPDSRLKSSRADFEPVVTNRQRGDLITPGVIAYGAAYHTDRWITGSDFGRTDQSSVLIGDKTFD
jgi:hypothetical protein